MDFDETVAKARGLEWTRDGDVLKITIPGHTGLCQVKVRPDGNMDLVPERSHHHRALIAALA